MKHTHKHAGARDLPRVLAISPMSVGFGYALFDHPQHLMDWGLSVIRVHKVARALKRLDILIAMYRPNAIVVIMPDHTDHKVTVANKLTTAFSKRAAVGMIPYKRYKQRDVQTFFSTFDALTKHEVAETLINWLPQLASHHPQRRALGDSQDMKINVFDAAAVALTFYAQHEDEQNH